MNQGATITPTYLDIHTRWEGSLTTSIKLDTSSPFDPDLIIHKHNFVQAVGQNIRQKAFLDKWVAIANVTHMDLEAFLNLDEFWQEAIFQSVNSFVKEQNKEQQST